MPKNGKTAAFRILAWLLEDSTPGRLGGGRIPDSPQCRTCLLQMCLFLTSQVARHKETPKTFSFATIRWFEIKLASLDGSATEGQFDVCNSYSPFLKRWETHESIGLWDMKKPHKLILDSILWLWVCCSEKQLDVWTLLCFSPGAEIYGPHLFGSTILFCVFCSGKQSHAWTPTFCGKKQISLHLDPSQRALPTVFFSFLLKESNLMFAVVCFPWKSNEWDCSPPGCEFCSGQQSDVCIPTFPKKSWIFGKRHRLNASSLAILDVMFFIRFGNQMLHFFLQVQWMRVIYSPQAHLILDLHLWRFVFCSEKQSDVWTHAGSGSPVDGPQVQLHNSSNYSFFNSFFHHSPSQLPQRALTTPLDWVLRLCPSVFKLFASLFSDFLCSWHQLLPPSIPAPTVNIYNRRGVSSHSFTLLFHFCIFRCFFVTSFCISIATMHFAEVSINPYSYFIIFFRFFPLTINYNSLFQTTEVYMWILCREVSSLNISRIHQTIWMFFKKNQRFSARLWTTQGWFWGQKVQVSFSLLWSQMSKSCSKWNQTSEAYGCHQKVAGLDPEKCPKPFGPGNFDSFILHWPFWGPCSWTDFKRLSSGHLPLANFLKLHEGVFCACSNFEGCLYNFVNKWPLAKVWGNRPPAHSGPPGVRHCCWQELCSRPISACCVGTFRGRERHIRTTCCADTPWVMADSVTFGHCPADCTKATKRRKIMEPGPHCIARCLFGVCSVDSSVAAMRCSRPSLLYFFATPSVDSTWWSHEEVGVEGNIWMSVGSRGHDKLMFGDAGRTKVSFPSPPKKRVPGSNPTGTLARHLSKIWIS